MDWAASTTPASTSARGGLHHAGDEGGGRDHQGHDGAQNPQFGAHDDLGKRA